MLPFCMFVCMKQLFGDSGVTKMYSQCLSCGVVVFLNIFIMYILSEIDWIYVQLVFSLNKSLYHYYYFILDK